MEKVKAHFEASWSEHYEDLKHLVRIPSVSFDGFPPEEVQRSANAVAELLKKRGLENVELIQPKGCHPYVYGDHLHAPGKPTLLLYAHHDVQPPGREEIWTTPPFEPTEKEGPGGVRLHARGAADDKAGVIVHTSAISSYLDSIGSLPVNVKVLIEGEEEIGSGHLFEFLKENQERLKADVIVLTDTANFDVGIPSLTVSLRGMVGVGIEFRALRGAIHSGMWGGPVPDPAMALCRVLGEMVDQEGQIAIPEIAEMVPPMSDEEKKFYSGLPVDQARIREMSGMVPGAKFLGEDSPWARMWRYPSLTVNAFEASSRKNAGNIINDTAWAKVTIRVASGMDEKRVAKALIEFINNRIPWGVEAKIEQEMCASPWKTDAKGKAFEAAERALEKGFGTKLVNMGCGGTIPFVDPFTRALEGAPALLIGVEDPFTNAHGENESLGVDDLKKACLSQIYLFQEIADSL